MLCCRKMVVDDGICKKQDRTPDSEPITYRTGRIRLISVRRVREEERELYHESQESPEDV